MFDSKVQSYVENAMKASVNITESRSALLDKLVFSISGPHGNEESVKLVFICTHNSRRSHMAQLWASIMAAYFEVRSIETYSGGTEATNFNTAAVDAMRRTGLDIRGGSGENPIYTTSYSSNHPPVQSFSKVYDHESNPSKGFIAVMTCSEADDNCPVVLGADQRVSLYYEDPKISDGTSIQNKTYDDRCRQIATEMAYVFEKVSEKGKK